MAASSTTGKLSRQPLTVSTITGSPLDAKLAEVVIDMPVSPEHPLATRQRAKHRMLGVYRTRSDESPHQFLQSHAIRREGDGLRPLPVRIHFRTGGDTTRPRQRGVKRYETDQLPLDWR